MTEKNIKRYGKINSTLLLSLLHQYIMYASFKQCTLDINQPAACTQIQTRCKLKTIAITSLCALLFMYGKRVYEISCKLDFEIY